MPPHGGNNRRGTPPMTQFIKPVYPREAEDCHDLGANRVAKSGMVDPPSALSSEINMVCRVQIPQVSAIPLYAVCQHEDQSWQVPETNRFFPWWFSSVSILVSISPLFSC